MSTALLTPSQMTDLGELLHQRHRELSLVVARELHADGAQELSVTASSDADWASADVDADALIARVERDSGELTEVANALDRVASGRYGVCETCGEAIEYPRLLAHPAARRCLQCQRVFETRATPPPARGGPAK